MAHPYNSGLALRIFLKFCRMKGANRYMKNLLVVFLEKIHFRQFVLFSLWAIFYCFIGHGQSDWARPLLFGSLNSQGMISFKINTGSINSQDMIRILKQSRQDFSCKHLCDGYCVDIM